MRKTVLISMLVGALLGACTNGGDTGAGSGRSKKIAQPVVQGLTIALEGKRVDLDVPTFSRPTKVTNPLFPVSRQKSVLLVGKVDGQPFRTEVTLLPETRIIEWEGQTVETLVSQYVAYLDGVLHEVAYDFYAQADDGSVWYFGEDVFNFSDGVIVDTHGTWIAGKDGPAAMIMPARPKVGDVYRPENIPGFVFEEVTVKVVGQKLDGPLGTIEGGLLIKELHMDGATEDKTFAPGYGEFFTGGGGDVEALALAVPTDAATGAVPAELTTLSTGALEILDAAAAGRWAPASRTVTQMAAAWERHKGAGVPRLVAPRLTEALTGLVEAVNDRNASDARQAAIDAARWSLDLQLRFRPPSDIDRARFDLWAAQLVLDAGARDAAAMNGDFFSLDYVRDRIQNVWSREEAARINAQLEELLGAVGDEDFASAAEAAGQLRKLIA